MSKVSLWCEDLEEWSVGGDYVLDREEAHHLKKVLRSKENQEVQLLNGRGRVGQAKVTSFGSGKTWVELLESVQVERGPKLQVFGPLPEGKRLSFMLEKLQELGVYSLTPLRTQYSEKRKEDLSGERWTKKLHEACKQSGSPWILEFGEEIGFSEVLLNRPLVNLDQSGLLPKDLQIDPSKPLCMTYGPEGGWSEKEAQELKGLSQSVRLSGQILRMETAAILGAGLLMAQ